MAASSAPEPATARPATPPRHSHAGTPATVASGSVFVALFVLALSLRPQLSAIGPLVPEILVDFGPSHAFVGLLTAIPVFCMGLFALVGPVVAGRFGTRGGVTLSVVVLIGCGILRALAPGAELVLLATFGLGVGTAVVGPILAMFVRNRMPGQNVGGTSAYAGGTVVGAAVGAALAVPLADAFGGWRASLLAISLLSILSVVTWLALVHRRPRPERDPGTIAAPARGYHLPQLPVRRGVVWAIAILFGLQSWLYYGQNAWLPSVYVELGWAPAPAAFLVSLVALAGIISIVGAPAAARRGVTRRALLTGASVSSTIGWLGVALVPGPAVVWAAFMGAGLGMMFTVLLTLPTDLSHDPRQVGGAAALMLLVGYLLAALAPTVLGAIRDAAGTFEPALWLLVAVGVAMIPLSWSLTPRRLHGHEAG
jgi:CP family cyanate transporter-like MFS transporter